MATDPELFTPGVPLSASRLNTHLSDVVSTLRDRDSHGLFDNGITESLSSTSGASLIEPDDFDPNPFDVEYAGGDWTFSTAGEVQVPVAGIYMIAVMFLLASGSGGPWPIRLRVFTGYNDSDLLYYKEGLGGGGYEDGLSVLTVMPLPEDAYVRIGVGQESGSSRNLNQYGLWVHKLSTAAVY